ncbi:MAG: RNA-binding protein AU-1 [uncultured archaeon A07HB70]|nr:MAG: RNA-binding protein AU-1 [uncultured archaeon A07HB70]
MDERVRTKVRGIYATALTRALATAGGEVTQASGPIRERFAATDAVTSGGLADARVTTTADRQGVTVAGTPGAVEAVAGVCRDVGVDTLAWTAAAPLDAVFDAEVTETDRGAATCDLGETTGRLPFDRVDAHVETGSRVRVQVADPDPPWLGGEPTLSGGVRVREGVVELVRGGSGVRVDAADESLAREVAGLLDMAGVAPAEGWSARFSRAATEATLDDLTAALDHANERAAALDDALAGDAVDAGEPEAVATPLATRFVWFGRESRAALDAARREVTPTMPGHHRTKAASAAASAGVDLAEALCGAALADGEFPFETVADQFGPREGDRVALEHGKPSGRLITLGRGEVVDRGADGTVAVERSMTGGGTYDALGTPREAGDTALTKVREGRWWYPTTYRDADGASKGTYVNVCTPVECFPSAVRYVDLHVDVVRRPDGEVERVDDDELDAAEERGAVPSPLADRAREVASGVERALR